jgi:hypothetical protein
MSSKPQVLACLICDAVHIDPGTGKHTILGVFSNIRARQFPVTHPHMAVFLMLTDVAVGEHRLRILMGIDPANAQPLAELKFASQNAGHRIELAGGFRNVAFPEPGNYAIVIELDNEPLLVTNIGVSQ